MTSAVCDSGPLTHLWQIDMWPIFGTLEALHIAEQVAQEVREHVVLDRMKALAGCTLHIHAVSEPEIEAVQRALPPETGLQRADWAIDVNYVPSPRLSGFVVNADLSNVPFPVLTPGELLIGIRAALVQAPG